MALLFMNSAKISHCDPSIILKMGGGGFNTSIILAESSTETTLRGLPISHSFNDLPNGSNVYWSSLRAGVLVVTSGNSLKFSALPCSFSKFSVSIHFEREIRMFLRIVSVRTLLSAPSFYWSSTWATLTTGI